MIDPTTAELKGGSAGSRLNATGHAGSQKEVASHYSHGTLEAAILAGLQAMGRDRDHIRQMTSLLSTSSTLAGERRPNSLPRNSAAEPLARNGSRPS